MSSHATHNPIARLVLPIFCLLMASFSINVLACSRNDSSFAQQSTDQSVTSTPTHPPRPESVTLATILKTAGEYDGRHLRVRCFYFEGFESVVLCTDVITNATGYYHVVNDKVWAVWKTRRPGQEIESRLRSVEGHMGPNYYGAVEVTGIFHVRGDSGHLGEYDYLFEIEDMQILKTE